MPKIISTILDQVNVYSLFVSEFFHENMFWKYNTNSSTQIDNLLAKEDVTLQEIMDAEDIINECRVQNKLVIDFLLKPEIMEELVLLITKEPPITLEERVRFKYSNIACELLTCDVPAIKERLASDESLLDKLYNFLDRNPPLNPLLASFFSKIMGALIAKKTEQVLDFLKAKDTFLSLLLKHLNTSAIMDLMLKLLTQIEGIETKQNILNWLDSQQVMQKLVSLFDPKVDSERHYNVAQLLCDFIRIARDNQRNSLERADPDPLLNTLESSETVALLLEHILGEEKVESVVVGGIQVLLVLVDVYQTSIPKISASNIYNPNNNEEANDSEHKQRVLNNITQSIGLRIGDFHNLLLDPPKTSPMCTTVGILDPPLGNTRLHVLKLYASVVPSNNVELLQKIISAGTFSLLLDLFFKFPWNNFLHAQVECCLVSALKTYVNEDSDDTSVALCKHLLENCKLIDRVLDAWEENDEQQKANGARKGYMGHLISLVNKLVELCTSTYFGQYLRDNLPDTCKRLEEFKENTLEEVNKVQNSLLGGAHPNTSNNNESDDFSDIPFPQASVLQQQMYTQYQVQHLSSQFIDGYSGFNDDTFNDGDDTMQSIDHRTEMNFDLSENDQNQAQELFKQVCAQSINTLDDADDQIFDDREQHTFQTVIEKQGDRNDIVYSSDSDDDSPGDENAMDVDPWNSPKTVSSEKLTFDPWGNLENNSSDANVGGWADFTNVNFEADFSKAFKGRRKEPRTDNDSKSETIVSGESSGGSTKGESAKTGRGEIETGDVKTAPTENGPDREEVKIEMEVSTKEGDTQSETPYFQSSKDGLSISSFAQDDMKELSVPIIESAAGDPGERIAIEPSKTILVEENPSAPSEPELASTDDPTPVASVSETEEQTV